MWLLPHQPEQSSLLTTIKKIMAILDVRSQLYSHLRESLATWGERLLVAHPCEILTMYMSRAIATWVYKV